MPTYSLKIKAMQDRTGCKKVTSPVAKSHKSTMVLRTNVIAIRPGNNF
jgi:hypothetical protein